MSVTLDKIVTQAMQWRRRHAIAIGRIAGLNLAILSLWFGGWLAVGDRLLIVRWGAYVAPWLGLLALVSAVLLLLGFHRLWASAAFVLALLILAPVLPRFGPMRLIAAAPPAEFSVMTFNTSMLNDDYREISGLIAREKPDIVFLQQIGDLSALQRALQAQAGHKVYVSYPIQTEDTVILSRYVLSDGRTIERQTTAIASIDGCRVRLWSMHAPHGQFDFPAQHRFFAEMAAQVRSDPLPIIVGGDFNSTEFNSVQFPLRNELTDAFSAAGVGLGFTFPSRVRRLGFFGPLFRIDHILVRSFDPISASVLSDSANSDHLPTMAWLTLAKDASASCSPRTRR